MVLGVFEQLANTSKKKEKEQILADNDSPVFRRVLHYALNPYMRFYIKKIPDFEPKGVIDLDQALSNLDDLANRTYTGHAGIGFLAEILSSVKHDDAMVLLKVIDKDLRCGVGASTVNKVFPGLIPEFSVQLCDGFEPDKLTGPVYQEPKIDGIRALAFIENGEVTFFSRGGKEIETLDHLKEEMLSLYPSGTILDGEAAAGNAFQDNISLIKRKKENKKEADIYFYAFDLITIDEFKAQKSTVPFAVRRQALVHDEAVQNAKFIRFNEIRMAENLDQVMDNYRDFIQKGYEGSIVKQPHGFYEFKRSRTWMKVKPFETMDVEVIGFQEGTGKHAGKLGALIVDFEGKECRIGTGFSDQEREEIWNNQDAWLGALVEMEFMERTDDGKSRHARYKGIRSYKGEKF